MFERTNEMLLTVTGSRLVRRSYMYVLPAARMNAVLVSSHGTAECYDVFKFRWAILDSTYVGLGEGLDEAVAIRNIVIFRYMWVFFEISIGLSIVR
jgi:hypothetical protein